MTEYPPEPFDGADIVREPAAQELSTDQLRMLLPSMLTASELARAVRAPLRRADFGRAWGRLIVTLDTDRNPRGLAVVPHQFRWPWQKSIHHHLTDVMVGVAIGGAGVAIISNWLPLQMTIGILLGLAILPAGLIALSRIGQPPPHQVGTGLSELLTMPSKAGHEFLTAAINADTPLEVLEDPHASEVAYLLADCRRLAAVVHAPTHALDRLQAQPWSAQRLRAAAGPLRQLRADLEEVLQQRDALQDMVDAPMRDAMGFEIRSQLLGIVEHADLDAAIHRTTREHLESSL